jgi:SAM-dependent methyltransferase
MIQHCKICDAPEAPKFLSNFRPYSDVDWTFPVYECHQCGVRFALRDPLVNYHEILHSTAGGGYESHYRIAERVKHYLAHGALNKCEQYLLMKAGYKYSELTKFIKTKSKVVSILEVGCSTGFVTAFLRSIGYGIEGIDISESAINYAKSTFGPFYCLQPKKKQYDIVIHLGLIGCVDDPKEFLTGYLDLLKPNGEMFFNAPNVESPKQLGELWVSTPPPDLIYLFNEKSFQYMLNNSFDVSCVKVSAKGEVIWKHVKKIMNKDYNGYPKIFRQNQQVYDGKRTLIKRMFSRIAMVNAYAIYPFLKKYDNEYGIFVTIKRK